MWKSVGTLWRSTSEETKELIAIVSRSRCVLGKLHSKVCILVTHQIQFLKYATKIIFLDKVNRAVALRIASLPSSGPSNRHGHLHATPSHLSGVYTVD